MISVPDHSTIFRTRRLMDVETHQAVFQWVLAVLAEKKLLKGTTIGIDATTLEANAALRSIVRRDTGERYEEFLTRLAKESGIETPTREQAGGAGSQAIEERLERRLDASARSRRAHHAAMKDGRNALSTRCRAHAVDHGDRSVSWLSRCTATTKATSETIRGDGGRSRRAHHLGGGGARTTTKS